MSHSRKRTLRPSFVMTFAASAAAALASACSGSAVTPCPDTGRCVEPQPEECPASVPMSGAACSVPSTASCNYGRQEACGGSPTQSARCSETTHTWSVNYSSCNPPPPTCPSTPPTDGASCTPGWGSPPQCGYDPCGADGQPTIQATCDYTARAWRVTQVSCNPPPPVCPSTPPAEGAPCTLAQASIPVCNYGDCSGGIVAPEHASCDSRSLTWRVTPLGCAEVDGGTDGGGGDASEDGGEGDGGVGDGGVGDGGVDDAGEVDPGAPDAG